MGPWSSRARRQARAGSAGWPTVGLEGERPTAAVPDLGGRALSLGLLPIDQDHVRAGLGDSQDRLAAEAPAPAGDEARLPVQTEPVEHPTLLTLLRGLVPRRDGGLDGETRAVRVPAGGAHHEPRRQHPANRRAVAIGDVSGQ